MPGLHSRGLQLFSYCCFTTERIAQTCTPDPLIGIILSGAKEIWLAGESRHFGPGAVFVLPAGQDFDVVNIPDRRCGLYESLLVAVPQGLPEKAGLPPPPLAPAGFDLEIRLTDDLVDALAHAAIGLQDSAHATTLAQYRLAEVLLLLAGQPAARPLFTVSLVDRVTWLVLAAPTHPWTARDIGRRLGMAEATLRRRLAQAGTSLREILAATRMGIAARLLTSGAGNVSQAAAAAGYASRSHFARRFENLYGTLPSQWRNKQDETHMRAKKPGLGPGNGSAASPACPWPRCGDPP
jgi:AraC-like DNA-binding protein